MLVGPRVETSGYVAVWTPERCSCETTCRPKRRTDHLDTIADLSNNLMSVESIMRDNGPARVPKKLILCFDGTGNTFTGSNADTNVVKILKALDRNDPSQYHYYQTGIGTYDINETSVNKSWFGEVRSSISQVVDQAVGTTFDAHVMAGYRFLMRYYDTGDKIYVFGFSRGAFTAKFLARMINTVGLLCKGNEEMVFFAYQLYQRYLAGETDNFKKGGGTMAQGESEADPLLGSEDGTEHHQKHHGHKFKKAHNEIKAFSKTFCRQEQVEHCGKVKETNIKVYFLGIWDCVNSVAVLEHKAPMPVPVKGTAQFIRHAVAVDERRVKFKAALLAQDIRASKHSHEDIKEVWFPGCHGDVGGGWPATTDHPLDNNTQMTFWQRIKNFWTTRKVREASEDVDAEPFQMSDVPLAWMIREIQLLNAKEPSAALSWRKGANSFEKRYEEEKNKNQALKGVIHDSLQFGYGTGFFTVLLWKFMEWLPIITRWELDITQQWKNVRFPLNAGSTRDIPKDAELHESLLWRLNNPSSSYRPKNNHGGLLLPDCRLTCQRIRTLVYE
ncbi:hypothetical protein M426DRAFT_72663 [Hypoxylon sp. CI-4A]|nr:hypothetical protein M426DRAFT_72663 [Hypoxylon sp. CI-4A]